MLIPKVDRKEAQGVITEFATVYEQPETAYRILWSLFDCAICSEYADDWTVEERQDIMFFYKQVVWLIAASFALQEKPIKPSPII